MAWKWSPRHSPPSAGGDRDRASKSSRKKQTSSKKKRFSETVWETAEILFIFFVEKNPLTWFRFQDRVTAGGGSGFKDRRGKSGILFLKDKSTVYYFGHKFFVKYLHVCPVPGEGVAAGRGGEDAADAETDLDKKLRGKKISIAATAIRGNNSNTNTDKRSNNSNNKRAATAAATAATREASAAAVATVATRRRKATDQGEEVGSLINTEQKTYK